MSSVCEDLSFLIKPWLFQFQYIIYIQQVTKAVIIVFKSILHRKCTRSKGLDVVAGNFAVLDKKPQTVTNIQFANTFPERHGPGCRLDWLVGPFMAIRMTNGLKNLATERMWLFDCC
jgi:hypothetical protein